MVILTDTYDSPPIVVYDSLIRAASPYMNRLVSNEPHDGEVRRVELQYDGLLQTDDIGIYVRWLYGVKLKDIFPVSYEEQVGDYARLYLSACELGDKRFTSAVMDRLITAIEEATLLSKTSDSAVRDVVKVLYQVLGNGEGGDTG